MSGFSDTRQEMEGFIRSFDEVRPNLGEAKQASGVLKEGIDELMLLHPECLVASNQHIIDGLKAGTFDNWEGSEDLERRAAGAPEYVDLRFVLEADDSTNLRVIARRYNLDTNWWEWMGNDPKLKPPIIMVMLNEELTDESDGKVVIYKMRDPYDNGNEVVTRNDVSDNFGEEIELRRQESPTPNFMEMAEDEVAAYLQGRSEASKEELKNLELEVEMGINGQPVGEEEIRGLLAVIDRATPLTSDEWDQRVAMRHQPQRQQETPEVVAEVLPDAPSGKLRKAARTIFGLLWRQQS